MVTVFPSKDESSANDFDEIPDSEIIAVKTTALITALRNKLEKVFISTSFCVA
jgi:hypothetical protein